MVSLRKIEPTDIPYMYQWENDASAWSDASLHNPLSQQDLRNYIESTTGDIYKDGQLRLIIEADGQTCGCVDLYDLDIRNRKVATGIYIAPQFRRQGYAQEALMLLEQYAFLQLNLRMLYAYVTTANRASSALYGSVGYKKSAKLTGWTLESDAVVWQKFCD